MNAVGTKSEAGLSLYMAIKRRGRESSLSAQPLRKTDPPVPQSMDNYFDNDNFVPQHLMGLLK